MKIRKTIVRWANDREIELEQEYQRLHKNTLYANKVNLKIKWLDLIACVFDPSGRIQAEYNCERMNQQIKATFIKTKHI
jgi:hypothetical protein